LASAGGSIRDAIATRTSRRAALETRARNSWPAAVEHRDGVADAEPQDTGEVLALLTRQGDRLVAGDPSRARRTIGTGLDY